MSRFMKHLLIGVIAMIAIFFVCIVSFVVLLINHKDSKIYVVFFTLIAGIVAFSESIIPKFKELFIKIKAIKLDLSKKLKKCINL